MPLRAVAALPGWAGPAGLAARFTSYAATHGARVGASGYLEGSLARIAEAGPDVAPALPSMIADPGFLCGTEFGDCREERAFFDALGLDVAGVEADVVLEPGRLLVFDNLMLAHGRDGGRRPGELHQRVFGHRLLAAREQAALRDRALRGFASGSA